jgi:hypothetical protein
MLDSLVPPAANKKSPAAAEHSYTQLQLPSQ